MTDQYNGSCNKSTYLGGSAPQQYVRDVPNRSELPEEIRLAIEDEVIQQLEIGTHTEKSLARAAGCSQPAISKIKNQLGVGRSVAEKLLRPLGFSSFDELVRKHNTRATANDIARYLHEVRDLDETLRLNASDWDADLLVRLIVRIKRNKEKYLSRPDGLPVRMNWAEELDRMASGVHDNANEGQSVGGAARLHKQIQKSGKKR